MLKEFATFFAGCLLVALLMTGIDLISHSAGVMAFGVSLCH